MNQIRVSLNLGGERSGDGLEIEGETALETVKTRPGIYVLAPEDAGIVALATRVEFHHANPQIYVDHHRLSPPHSEEPQPDPGEIPPEQITANELRHDCFLGALALAVGKRMGYSENDFSIAA